MKYYLTCGHCGAKFLNSTTHCCEELDVDNKAEKLTKFFMDFLQNPKIKEIRISGCATIIWFLNGEKSVTKCRKGDTWRYDLGILFAWVNYHRKKKTLSTILSMKNQKFTSEMVLAKHQQQVIKNLIKKSTENFKIGGIIEKTKNERLVELPDDLKNNPKSIKKSKVIFKKGGIVGKEKKVSAEEQQKIMDEEDELIKKVKDNLI